MHRLCLFGATNQSDVNFWAVVDGRMAAFKPITEIE